MLPNGEMDEQLHTKEEDSVFPFISESDSWICGLSMLESGTSMADAA